MHGATCGKGSKVGFVPRMAKRKNVQPFASLAGQFAPECQVLREGVVSAIAPALPEILT
jgi:hypothetical protein